MRATVAAVMAATGLVVALGPAAPPAGAEVHPYTPNEPGLNMPGSWGYTTLNDTGTSIGWAAARQNDLIEPDGGGRRYYFAVADQDVLGGTRDLQVLDVPGRFAHEESAIFGQLSGDGQTFVGQHVADPDTLGACSRDLDDPTFGAQYWNSQIVVWERSTPTGDFDDPELVTRSLTGSGCDGIPADGGPDLMGVGGDGGSNGATVSQDGETIAFMSRATDLVASPPTPTDPYQSALYIAEADGSGGWDISLVTPPNMNGGMAYAKISGDGDSIVFNAQDTTNLVPGVTLPPNTAQTYLATRTLTGWDFEIISLDSNGDPLSDEWGNWVDIDNAGERVLFHTYDDAFDSTVDVPGGDPDDLNIVLHDVATGVNQGLVTRAAPTAGLLRGQDLGEYTRGVISWDGKRVSALATRWDDTAHGSLYSYRADDAFSTDPDDRRAALIERVPFEADSVNPDSLSIGGAGPYIAAFGSEELQDDPTELDAAINFVTIEGGAVDPAKGWHGDPVDTATGDFRHDETDLAPPGGAGPAALERTYTSVGDAEGVFGPGWESNLDVRLSVDEDVVTLREPGGTTFDYGLGAAGWEPLDAQAAVLEQVTGGWTVTGAAGDVREFDADGRIVAVRRPGEPEVTITWGGLAPTAMTSASGYEVTFEDWTYELQWDPVAGEDVPVQIPDPDGLIDRATTSDGRQVDFGYQDPASAHPRLRTASRPHTAGQTAGTYGVRTYEVTGTLLTSIVDQVDATRTRLVVENTYDEQGRVVHQVTDTGDELDFAYAQKPDGMGNLVPTTGFTTVTNQASGDVTVYEHNVAGEVVGVTDAEGSSIGVSWEDGRPSVRESRSGVTTEHTYDDAGRLVEVTQTAGSTTRTMEERTYVTSDSSPSALTDDRIATRTDTAGVTTTYTYSGSSRLPATESLPCDPASTDPSTPCPPSGRSTTTYTYHSGGQAGLVASVTDADGVVTEYGYGADRALVTTTTYDGVTPLVTTYATVRPGDPGWAETNPAAVEVRTTEAPGGGVTAEVYDAEGRRIEVRDPLYDGTTHLATTYAYGLDGELVSETDPAGDVTTYAVARPGDPGWAEDPEIALVRTKTGPDGVSTITKTDRSGHVVVEQRGDPAVPGELATTTHTYGPLGRRLSTTDPTGVTTTYEYDVEGRGTAVVDEDGERTETEYDAFGRVSVVTDPRGGTTTTTYDADGRVETVEDREGHDTTTTYDDAGRVHTVTDARGGVTERTYTPAGRVAAATDATARTTSYTYDTAGRRVTVEQPSGATTTTAYDLDGLVATVTSPEGRVTSSTYDDLGRRLTMVDPMRGTTTTTYRPDGLVATETDATGGEVAFTYDGDRVATVTDPLNRVTTYGYDSRGNRTSRTDALSGVEEWEYDLADRVTKEIDQLDRETVMTYDDLGRLETRTDGAGRTETLAYDEAGQVVSSQFGTVPVTFTYDGEGRRTTVTSSVGTTTWTYDEVGNPTAIDEVGTRDLSWTWDLAGRRVEITLPTGERQRNVYDADGIPAGVERWDGSAWVDSVDLAVDDDGLLVGRDVVGGMDATWDRDPDTALVETLTEDLGGTITTTDLTHDAAGRVETEVGAAGTTTYDYDDAGQLTSADRPGTADDETFAYDELGRRTTSTEGATSTTYAWDAASQLTSRTIGGTAHTYTYDGSGRRTGESWNTGTSSRQWAYSARGELNLIRHTTPSGTDETSRYLRGDGRILSSTSTPAGGSARTTVYAWDTTQSVPQPAWMRIGTSNEVTTTYAAGPARLQCTSTTLDCEGPVAHDVRGSAVETPATDDVVAADGYRAFGDPGTAVLDPELGFRGELHTADLVHLRARDYDPESGTFLRPDPLDGVDGTTTVANPYHYVDNDPVNRADPTGLQPTDEDLLDIGDALLEEFSELVDLARATVEDGLDRINISGRCADIDGIPIPGIDVSDGLCAIDDGNKLGALGYWGAGGSIATTAGVSLTLSLFLGVAEANGSLRGPAVCLGGGVLVPVFEVLSLGASAALCLSTRRSLPLLRLQDPLPSLSDFTGVATLAGGVSIGTPGSSLSIVVTHTWVEEYDYPSFVGYFCDRILDFEGGFCGL